MCRLETAAALPLKPAEDLELVAGPAQAGVPEPPLAVALPAPRPLTFYSVSKVQRADCYMVTVIRLSTLTPHFVL